MQGLVLKTLVVLAATAMLYSLVQLYDAGLRNPRYFDGWVLFVAMAGQVAFRVRRAYPAQAWGRVSYWMQAHLCIGYFSAGAFALHSNFELPDSRLGWLLWCLFVLVSLTGILGAYLCSTVPARLLYGAEPIMFDEIAGRRNRLAAEAEALVAQSVAVGGLQSVSELYTGRLHRYFDGPRNVLSHLRGARGPLHHLCEELDNLNQFAGEQAASTVGTFKNLVIAKDRLDFQFANEGALKIWLFLHIPATYCLVCASILHVLVTYAYTSGVP